MKDYIKELVEDPRLDDEEAYEDEDTVACECEFCRKDIHVGDKCLRIESFVVMCEDCFKERLKTAYKGIER